MNAMDIQLLREMTQAVGSALANSQMIKNTRIRYYKIDSSLMRTPEVVLQKKKEREKKKKRYTYSFLF